MPPEEDRLNLGRGGLDEDCLNRRRLLGDSIGRQRVRTSVLLFDIGLSAFVKMSWVNDFYLNFLRFLYFRINSYTGCYFSPFGSWLARYGMCGAAGS